MGPQVGRPREYEEERQLPAHFLAGRQQGASHVEVQGVRFVEEEKQGALFRACRQDIRHGAGGSSPGFHENPATAISPDVSQSDQSRGSSSSRNRV